MRHQLARTKLTANMRRLPRGTLALAFCALVAATTASATETREQATAPARSGAAGNVDRTVTGEPARDRLPALIQEQEEALAEHGALDDWDVDGDDRLDRGEFARYRMTLAENLAIASRHQEQALGTDLRQRAPGAVAARERDTSVRLPATVHQEQVTDPDEFLFQRVDRNANGIIDRHEFAWYRRATDAPYPATPHQRGASREIDVQRLTPAEKAKLQSPPLPATEHQRRLTLEDQAEFARADRDGDGILDSSELARYHGEVAYKRTYVATEHQRETLSEERPKRLRGMSRGEYLGQHNMPATVHQEEALTGRELLFQRVDLNRNGVIDPWEFDRQEPLARSDAGGSASAE